MLKKVLLGLLCVVLAGLLGFGILHSRREDQAKALALEEINEQLEPLRVRKQELEAELAGLKLENDELMGGMATLSVLVTDLDSGFVAQIAPMLQAAGIPAVVALSQEQFPGNEGLITVAEFRQLLESGWDYCAAWDGSVDFAVWYSGMAQQLEEIGLAMSEVLYCAERSYITDLDEAAQARGFSTIVHSGEKNLPIEDTAYGSLWKPGSIWWNTPGVRDYLEQVIEKHGNTVLMINQVEFYASSFNAMLNLVKYYEKEEALISGTFAQAKAYHEEQTAKQAELQNEAYALSVCELSEKIEAITEEMQTLLTEQQRFAEQ